MDWIMSANKSIYDYDAAFENLKYIYWRQNRNYEVGDTIYIYGAKPDQKIRFKVVVVEKDIPYSNEIANYNKYFINKNELASQHLRTFMKIEKVVSIDSELLNLEHLQSHGLNGRVQGGMHISKELREYIESIFNTTFTDEVVFPDEISSDQKCIEGAKKTIKVNAYERDRNARRQCLNYYKETQGRIKCQICGFDFGKFYGEKYSNMIHVHHIRELSSIGKSYVVNPIKDLIPVCPNCHMILHSKECKSIEELKDLIAMKNE